MGNLCTSRDNAYMFTNSLSDIEIVKPATTKISDSDFRIFIIQAYTHQIHRVLIQEYNNMYLLFDYIPSTINKIIASYYDKYQIYGVMMKQHKIHHLPALEHVVHDANTLYNAQNTIYIKDLQHQMHSFVYTLNVETHQLTLYETNPFTNFMDRKYVEMISHSKFNDTRKTIKMKDGVLYQRINKKNNGYQAMTYFKKKKIDIIQIDAGNDHTLFLTSNGSVYAMGSNQEGQCGCVQSKTCTKFNNPTLIKTFGDHDKTHIISISCGYAHNCCVASDGSLWTFGRNTSWQCTPQEVEYISVPQRHPSFSHLRIVKAKCGTYFSVILSETGLCYGLGNIIGSCSEALTEFGDGICLIDCRNKVTDFDVGTKHVVWATSLNDVFSLHSQYGWKQWHNWSSKRYFYTAPWNVSMNTVISWSHEMFPYVKPSSIEKIVVGKNYFVLVAK